MAGNDPIQLLASAHGSCFRLLCSSMNCDYVGATVAARSARRTGRINAEIAKKIEKLDTAFNFLRHVNHIKCLALVDELDKQLNKKPKDVERADGTAIRRSSNEDPRDVKSYNVTATERQNGTKVESDTKPDARHDPRPDAETVEKKVAPDPPHQAPDPQVQDTAIPPEPAQVPTVQYPPPAPESALSCGAPVVFDMDADEVDEYEGRCFPPPPASDRQRALRRTVSVHEGVLTKELLTAAGQILSPACERMTESLSELAKQYDAKLDEQQERMTQLQQRLQQQQASLTNMAGHYEAKMEELARLPGSLNAPCRRSDGLKPPRKTGSKR